jgi:hypothetical protein
MSYTQNMSEPEERPYAGTKEPSEEEKGKEIETDRSTMEEEKKFPEQEEKEEVKKRPKKNKAEPKRKEGEFSMAISLSKQLEKQTNYLARLEEILPPLLKLAKP